MTEHKSKKTGPKPDRVKVDGDWEEAIDKALKKPRPKDGWPEPENKVKKKDQLALVHQYWLFEPSLAKYILPLNPVVWTNREKYLTQTPVAKQPYGIRRLED